MDTLPFNASDTHVADKPPWSIARVETLYALPFNDLIYRAHGVHRQHFDANAVQLSTLLSVKRGSFLAGWCDLRHNTDHCLLADWRQKRRGEAS